MGVDSVEFLGFAYGNSVRLVFVMLAAFCVPALV